GISLSFCDHEERAYLKDIQKLIRQTIPVMEDHPFHLEGVQPPEKGGNDDSDDDRPSRRNNRPNNRSKPKHKPSNNPAKSRRPKNSSGQAQDNPAGGARKKKKNKKHYRPSRG
ncbi:MAG: hypothetical protein HOJ34_14610, partial [Kordiimonadaceae bacterium]|nr:hypothetical protein [Kordiimonadaceae bacterium]